MIQFVSNQYEHIFQFLSSEYKNFTSSTSTSSSSSKYTSIMVDFCELSKTISKKKDSDGNDLTSFPLFKHTLNYDGTVPVSLLPVLPIIKPGTNIQVSFECVSLIHGLLDLRIPQRLGSLTHFSEFENHIIFLKHNYDVKHISHVISPLRVYSLVYNNLPFRSNHYHRRSQKFDQNIDPQLNIDFSPYVEQRLSQFYYISPERYAMKRNHYRDENGINNKSEKNQSHQISKSTLSSPNDTIDNHSYKLSGRPL